MSTKYNIERHILNLLILVHSLMAQSGHSSPVKCSACKSALVNGYCETCSVQRIKVTTDGKGKKIPPRYQRHHSRSRNPTLPPPLIYSDEMLDNLNQRNNQSPPPGQTSDLRKQPSVTHPEATFKPPPSSSTDSVFVPPPKTTAKMRIRERVEKKCEILQTLGYDTSFKPCHLLSDYLEWEELLDDLIWSYLNLSGYFRIE